MRARISMGLGAYWSGVAYALDVIAAITALGAIGGLPAVLNALTQYTRFAMGGLRSLKSRAATPRQAPAITAARLCHKG